MLLGACTSQVLELPIPGKKSPDATSVTSGSPSNSGADQNGVANTGPTSTVVDPPVSTAGAFLVCRADIESMPDPTMAMGGCKLVREEVKYDAWRADFSADASVIPSNESQAFAPEILAAMNVEPITDDFDAWHWRVTYPRATPLMQFQLQLTPVNGGAMETVRAYFKGQEWIPIKDEDAVLKFSTGFSGTSTKPNQAVKETAKASADDAHFYMLPPSFKATLNLGSTAGVVVTFSGLRPVPFGPCRFEAVGTTEVTGSSSNSPLPFPVPNPLKKRTTPDPVAVFFEMIDNCKDAKAGQIRVMKDVEFTVERPKDQTADLKFDIVLPALEQRSID